MCYYSYFFRNMYVYTIDKYNFLFIYKLYVGYL